MKFSLQVKKWSGSADSARAPRQPINDEESVMPEPKMQPCFSTSIDSAESQAEAPETLRNASRQHPFVAYLRQVFAWPQEPHESITRTRVRELEDYPKGYPRLAAFNASEQNFMLYRGFSYVHARLLLDLQAIISSLERELRKMDECDNESEDGQRHLSCTERDMRTHEKVKDKQRTRRQVLDELRERVSQYDDILMKSRELVTFQKPTGRDYRSVRTWFYNTHPLVEEEEEYIEYHEDVVTPRSGREWAGFDGLVESFLHRLRCKPIEALFCTKDVCRKSSDEHVFYFSPARVEKLVGLIITTVIFILLIIPVVAMYKLTSFGDTNSILTAIGVMVIFTLLFAAAISLLTKAKRHELFAASAAYCAVLVVFITNFSN
ncbi:hypothetical protein B0J12DRAFT_316977 [Macrophomina phaseolina]|uniref:DUF6594 domain-containing protein n=1 Tax=Macrophomina phaseolina TaxID=35725 RepID=A0ABQ8FWH7_9PEZI|nr:hypothetical protein B0J12DRAFT_316977 [Macrophomina phaseolina]